MAERIFIIYDGRACGGESADGSLLCTADSLKAAKSDARRFGQCACFSYQREGKHLVDERREFEFYLPQYVIAESEATQ